MIWSLIWSLMRRNPALEGLRGKWPVVALVTGTLMVNIVSFLAATDQLTPQPLLLVGAGLMPMLYLIWGPAGARCRSFDLALPIPTGVLWLAHLLALLTAGLSMLAVTLGAVKGFDLLLVRVLDADLLAEVRLVPLALQVTAWLVLAVAILQTRDPDLYEINRDRRYRWFAGAVGGGLCLLMAAGSFVSPWLAVVPVVVAIALYARLYRALPVVFATVPREAGSPGARAGSLQSPGSTPVSESARTTGAGSLAAVLQVNRPGWLRWHLLILPFVYRTLAKNVLGLIVGSVACVLLSMLLTDIIMVRFTDANLRIAMIPMMSYLLMSGAHIVPTRMFLLDALPISRRWLFGAMTIPGFLGMAFGYGVGNLIVHHTVETPTAICSLQEEGHQGLCVLPRFFEIANDGVAPWITAPWKENCQAWSLPLGKAFGAVLYKPFTTDENSSPYFIAWQLSRAVEAMYGETIDPDELAARYFVDGPDGTSLLPEGPIPITDDYPHLRLRGDGPFFPVMFMIVSVLWLLAYSVYLRVCRPGVGTARRKAVFWGVMAALFSLYVLKFVSWMVDWLDADLELAAIRIWMRDLPELVPGGTVAVYIICAVLVYGAFRIARRQFVRFESSAASWDEGCSVV